MEKVYFDYTQYHNLISQVVEQVKKSGFVPDVVLGVARGGLFLADGLSRSLKKPMAVVMASSYVGTNGTEQSEIQISSSVATLCPIQGNILLVDDLADSGETLHALRDHLAVQYSNITHLKTAVIWVKASSTFLPDFYAQHLLNDAWIVQPFEIRDFQ